MATKGRPHHEEAWVSAKKICQLNARQVEMARSLGMNPKKLPRLRPGPQQRWKLPVGEFIEACYRKRFGGDPHQHSPEAPSCQRPAPQQGVDAPKPVADAMSQVRDLACYFMNLADDLEEWLAAGALPPEVLSQVVQELREILEALETGAPIWPVPAILLPPHRARRRALSRQGNQNQKHAPDDEIPF